MSTTLTPPPATPPTPPAPGSGPAPTPRRSGPRVVAILTAIAGGTILLVTVVSAILSTVWGGRVETATLTEGVGGVASVEVRASAAEVEVTFGDVAEAELTVTGARGVDDWSVSRRGDRLVIEARDDWWGQWRWANGTTQATLVLPERLEGLDATLDLDAGSLRAEGAFGDLALALGAGSLNVSGSAETLELGVDAGSAHVELADVDSATIDLSAGRITGALTGSAPASVDIEVSAGSADLDLPDDTYTIAARTDAGSFRHDLDESSSAPHRIDVRVSAGSVDLSSGR